MKHFNWRTIKLFSLVAFILITFVTATFAINNIKPYDNQTVNADKTQVTSFPDSSDIVNTPKKSDIINTPKEPDIVNTQKEPKLPKSILEKREREWIKELSQKYGRTEDEINKLKSELGDMNKVSEKLQNDKKESKMLSDERVIELIKKGIGISEVEKAEDLASRCNKSTEEILQMKIRRSQELQKSGSNTVTESMEKSNEKVWNDIAKELGLEKKAPIDEFQIPDEILGEMKAKGLTEKEIIDMALLSENFGKSYKEVWDEFKKGSSYKILLDKYNKERLSNTATSDPKVSLQKMMQKKEKEAKEKLNATDKEISSCKENGFNGFDIYMTKLISIKSNLSFEYVMELRKKSNNWPEIAKELGVTIDEM